MKLKALRRKDTKEFVHIQTINDMDMSFTCELPNPMNPELTMDEIVAYYPQVDMTDYELVEFDLIESDVVNADMLDYKELFKEFKEQIEKWDKLMEFRDLNKEEQNKYEYLKKKIEYLSVQYNLK